MKKLLAMTMAIVLVALCAAVGVSADSTATSTVNKVEAKQGDTVTFTATLSEEVKVKSGGIEISYDETVLELVEDECAWEGEILDALLAEFPTSSEPGFADGGFAFRKATDISGVVFTATFKVLDTAAYGTTDVCMDLTLKDENDEPMTVTNNKGSITLKKELLSSYINVDLAAPETWVAGDTIEVTATAKNTTDDAIGAVNFVVTYDKTKVAPVLPGFDSDAFVSWENADSIISDPENDGTVGCFAMVVDEADALAKDGTVVFTLKFKVLDAADGDIVFGVADDDLWAQWVLDPDQTVLPGTAGADVTVEKYVAPESSDPSTDSSDPSTDSSDPSTDSSDPSTDSSAPESSTPESSAPSTWTPTYKDVDENGAWGDWSGTTGKPEGDDAFDYKYAIEKVGTNVNVAVKYTGPVVAVAADATTANGTGTNFRTWFAAKDGTAWGALADVYYNGTEWKASFRTNGGTTEEISVNATATADGVEFTLSIPESKLGFTGAYSSFIAVSSVDSNGANHCLNSNNTTAAGNTIEAYANGTVAFTPGTAPTGDAGVYVFVGIALVALIGTAVVIRRKA